MGGTVGGDRAFDFRAAVVAGEERAANKTRAPGKAQEKELCAGRAPHITARSSPLLAQFAALPIVAHVSRRTLPAPFTCQVIDALTR